MPLLTSITKGKARIHPEGLRCAAPRDNDPARDCNKLIAKRNDAGQIAGNFLCERCRQVIEVKLIVRETGK